jgi:hypothetical protein
VVTGGEGSGGGEERCGVVEIEIERERERHGKTDLRN